MPSEKAVRQRDVRITKSKERHFNMPLRHFIEHKYPDIFEEYRDLYNQMVINHPRRINLTKSITFKKWRTSIEPTNNHTPEDLSAETADQDLSPEAPAVVVQVQETEQDQPPEAPAIVVQVQETEQDLPPEAPAVVSSNRQAIWQLSTQRVGVPRVLPQRVWSRVLDDHYKKLILSL